MGNLTLSEARHSELVQKKNSIKFNLIYIAPYQCNCLKALYRAQSLDPPIINSYNLISWVWGEPVQYCSALFLYYVVAYQPLFFDY